MLYRTLYDIHAPPQLVDRNELARAMRNTYIAWAQDNRLRAQCS